MATTTATITLSSTDLLSDELALTSTATLTKTTTATGIEDTTGLSRKKITSTDKGTASGQVTLYTADDFAAIPYLYIKNLDTTAGNRIFVYDDTSTGDPLQFQLDAGDWGFIPMHGDKTYKAYATTNPTTIEFMVLGQDQ
tara:strand:+ start:142 stop:561 length:420 start_codon:yes stop_codon:yes gene_type:complete